MLSMLASAINWLMPATFSRNFESLAALVSISNPFVANSVNIGLLHAVQLENFGVVGRN
jgi:hypothetical protein